MLSHDEIKQLTTILLTSILRDKVKGTYEIAKATAELCRDVSVSLKKGDSTDDLLKAIRYCGRLLERQAPQILCIGNVVRRVLYIIRDEHVQARVEESKDPSTPQDLNSSFSCEVEVYHEQNLKNLLQQNQKFDFSQKIDIKKGVISSINELIDELEVFDDTMTEKIEQHIHTNEVILTVGKSHTVSHVLQTAITQKKINFKAIVTDHAPTHDGQAMAKTLAEAGISTTLISDAAVYAIMGRVNKVIVGTHAILANGGLVAPAGTLLVAMAAKKHNIPVVVCTGLYKLSPIYPVDQDSFTSYGNPGKVLPFTELALQKNVHVHNPNVDYVPREFIDLFITNNGIHNPSYIYRLLAEYYDYDRDASFESDESDDESSGYEVY